jgi:hypothetical protein
MEQPEPREKQVKKPYVSPVLTRYGDIDELTHGSLPTTTDTEAGSKVG